MTPAAEQDPAAPRRKISAERIRAFRSHYQGDVTCCQKRSSLHVMAAPAWRAILAYRLGASNVRLSLHRYDSQKRERVIGLRAAQSHGDMLLGQFLAVGMDQFSSAVDTQVEHTNLESRPIIANALHDLIAR